MEAFRNTKSVTRNIVVWKISMSQNKTNHIAS
jgi:hypothetical protein